MLLKVVQYPSTVIMLDMKSRLILMCGLPGSGKTTAAKNLASSMPAVRLCPDDWLRGLGIDLFDESVRDRLECQLWSLAKELLKLGQNVILEFGFWSRSERDKKRLWAHDNDMTVELHFLDVPIPELLRRVQSRHSKDSDSEAHITRDHLEEWSRAFQTPDEDELRLFDPHQIAAESH